MNIYTVSFFGHRKAEITLEIEKRLDKILYDIISQNNYVQFLIGRDGEFDLFASSRIKSAISKYSYGNVSFILVLPYMKADYRNNKQSYHEYYDEVEVCTQSSDVYYKNLSSQAYTPVFLINFVTNFVEKSCRTSSTPAIFRLVIDKIIFKNPNIFLVKTGSKSAIQVRNKNMVDRSDLVICCIEHESGGAYKTVQYAEKQNCRIINISKDK